MRSQNNFLGSSVVLCGPPRALRDPSPSRVLCVSILTCFFEKMRRLRKKFFGMRPSLVGILSIRRERRYEYLSVCVWFYQRRSVSFSFRSLPFLSLLRLLLCGLFFRDVSVCCVVVLCAFRREFGRIGLCRCSLLYLFVFLSDQSSNDCVVSRSKVRE